MLKQLVILWLLIITVTTVQAADQRCGWLSRNSVPDFWRLTDAKADWIFPLQGDDEIDYESGELLLDFDDHAFSCACLTVTTDKKTQRILKIHKAKQQPLKKCQNDKKLPAPE